MITSTTNAPPTEQTGVSRYKIVIRTDMRHGAGTHAAITVTLVGARGESGPHKLGKLFHGDFKPGAEDVYEIEGEDLGELVLLRFTNPGDLLGGDWLLDFARVTAGGKSWYFPHFRWVLAHSTAEVLEGTARLPQKSRGERDATARAAQIEGRRAMYPWRPAEATVGFPGALDISKARPLPHDEKYRGLTEGSYELTFAKTLAAIELAAPLVTKAWDALVDVADLFHRIEIPPVARRWQDDFEFARQAVQGVSPLHITLATALPAGFPLADDAVRGLLSPGTSLAQALASKRVFALDFEILDGIPMFHHVDKHGVEERRWAPPARCLLYLDDARRLRPLAIQLGRDPERDPVFTPNDTPNDWLAAKMFVRCSEGNVHQMVSHALRTHFVMEPFVMATMRNLSDPHPVYKLLRRHFRYTLAINDGARVTLLAEGGVFDDFISTGGPDKGHVALGKKGFVGWKLADNQPRRDLEHRGVLDPAVLPYYPYRDDALALWDAIDAYVGDVLGHFYASDADLVNDTEMAAFWADLTTRGLAADKLPCATLTRVADLREILATVVFTVSVQHCAVNYLQYEHYAFVPNAPLAMRRAPPRERGKIEQADIAAMLPSKSQTLKQVAIGRALASFGDDEEFLLQDAGWREDYFAEPELAAIRERFQGALRAALDAAKARNAAAEVPYTLLQPDRIPCGITI
jgi:arachidonate 5-lipoxygenase